MGADPGEIGSVTAPARNNGTGSRRAPARRPVVLCVLDGWGHRDEREDNAVALAGTPVFDRLWATCPRALLSTSGRDVGLPDGQFGNSEVGHMNIGAGRVVEQELVRIDRAIEEGRLAGNEALRGLIEAARESGGRCHLMGLLSPGGVHSQQAHIAALARVLAEAGIPVILHPFLDGRDTPPSSALGYLERFRDELGGAPADFGTVAGRYHAMDRDKRWDRTRLAYEAIVLAEGPRAESPEAAIRAAYDDGTTDEFVKPAVIDGYDGMRDGDVVLVANFRADRVRQLLDALTDPGFAGFERARVPRLAAVAGMVSYSESLDGRLVTLFPPQRLERLMGGEVARAGLTQLRIAETEKYPHVTFFFNGGDEGAYPGEERNLVPSPRVATYDLQPEMSAPEVTDRLVEAIAADRFDFVLVNYANPDMVGHTGVLEAAIAAVETVDGCLGRVLEALSRRGGVALVTADHGNCELMRDPETGGPHTAHTLFPVPCVLVGGPEGARLRDGRLADVAPTLLALLGLDQPEAMTGRSLLLPAEAAEEGADGG
jgi:2,3-bisphosphoglycerate-independent phosphoglycerate mutase